MPKAGVGRVSNTTIMENDIINEARNALKLDLQSASYILNDSPLGHSATNRKINQYIFTCVKEGLDKVDCRDWLFDLYDKLDEKNKNEFQNIIHAVTDALYAYNTFLKKCN